MRCTGNYAKEHCKLQCSQKEGDHPPYEYLIIIRLFQIHENKWLGFSGN